jgi:NTP pyrophosphatase (non-canonical NTP hydrolase)
VSLNALAKKHWQWIEDMGWHNKRVLEDLALVGSEVGEACNECRGDTPTPEFGGELADIVLRVMDCAVTYGVDLDAEIKSKMAKNLERGNYKGRLK